MRRPRAVRGAVEHLDQRGHDEPLLEESLEHIRSVNRWLGARRALLIHLRPLLEGGPARVLDVGTGAADLPLAIAADARRRGARPCITAVDIHPQVVCVARDRTRSSPEIGVVAADAFRLPFRDGAFDISLLSMTLHHFEGGARQAALRELARVGRHVIVGELERCWPNYLGALALSATVWRRNPITRHDGPLSVLRAFTTTELLDVARAAQLVAPRVHRHCFHRLVLVGGDSQWRR